MSFTDGINCDINWGGNSFQLDNTSGTLKVLSEYKGRLIDESEFIRVKKYQEKDQRWVNPVAYAHTFHDKYPMASADNVRIASSLAAIVVYERFYRPLEEIDEFAREYLSSSDDPLLPFDDRTLD